MATNSTQHKLDRVRPPRVQITYDVEIGNAIEQKELPFVVGVLADLAGGSTNDLTPLKDRKFIDIDRDNIDQVMASLGAQLPLRVSNVLEKEPTDLNVSLSFSSLEDLNPMSIVQQVPALKDLYTKRVALSDMLSKLDGNDALEAELRAIIEDPKVLAQLQTELGIKQS